MKEFLILFFGLKRQLKYDFPIKIIVKDEKIKKVFNDDPATASVGVGVIHG